MFLSQTIRVTARHAAFLRRAAVSILLITSLVSVTAFADEGAPPAPSGFKMQVKKQFGKIKAWTEPLWRHIAPLYNKAAANAGKRLQPVTIQVKKQYSKTSSIVGKWWGKQWNEVQKTDMGKRVASQVALAGGAMREAAQKVNVTPVKETQAVIRLKNGSSISCEIVSEDARQVVAFWEGGQVTFSRNEIAGIDRQRQVVEGDGIVIAEPVPADAWQYLNNPVVKLTNGQVIDGRILSVDGDVVIVKEEPVSGSSIHHEVPRNRIEALAFRPLEDDRSGAVAARLRELFPRMKFYQDGMVTLVTDSQGASLKTLRQSLQGQVTAIYLEFEELFRGREPQLQHYVVVFDRLEDYFTYAITDGVPAWLCPGYFSPTDKVLFTVNYFGDSFSALLYEAVSGARKNVNSQAEAIKGKVDERFHAQVDGAADDVKKRYESAVAYLRGLFMDITLTTLRHEITHEMLHDWGLQTIIVSKLPAQDERLLKKKRELLETKDIEQKKKLIVEILGERRKEDSRGLRIDAANSWFVEGVAEYASTSAVGRPNRMRLFAVKEAKRKGELLPLEQLTVYRMGSFPGVAEEAVLSAYAQSWSLVDYLMKHERTGFLEYLDRMSRETPSGSDDLNWLLRATGKELRQLEAGWHNHIDSLERTEDPEIEQWLRVREILGIQ